MRETAMLMLFAVATLALADDSGENVRASVKVYVVRNVSDPNLNVSWAESITSHIFAGAGVRIKWQFGEPSRREQHMPIIVDLSSNTPETLATGALAFAQVYEGVHISVFCDRIKNTVGGSDRLGTFLLAHEIVHILEGIDRHSKTGLMKASWTHKEIEAMSAKSLSLAPEDVNLIRRGLLK